MSQELQIALIAAAAALTGSLLGSWLTRTTEHKQWRRNRATEAYGTFLQAVNPLSGDTLVALYTEEGLEPFRRKIEDAYTDLILFGSDDVVDEALSLINLLKSLKAPQAETEAEFDRQVVLDHRAIMTAAHDFVDAVRRELGTSKRLMGSGYDDTL